MATKIKQSSFTKVEQRSEILKCGKNPVYFFNKYCMIQTKGGRSLFKTYDFQNNCLNEFRNNKHVVVNKSRQLGLSTLVASYAVWLALFRRDQNILVLATKLEVAKNFINKCKFVLANIPEWMNICDIQCNVQDIILSNGSKIKAIPTSKDAGRSEALSLLIIDEAAHIEDLDTIWTGLSPTISQSGGSVIFISSPLGTGNIFYEICKEADENPNSEFKLLTLPWNVHPERDEVWFEAEKKKMNGNLKKIAQEYECSFNASGNTVLDIATLEELRKAVIPPIERLHTDRNLWIWKHPVEEHRYILSADTALGEAKDDSAFHVIDDTSKEVVAEYVGKEPPDKFAELINMVGMRYNKALVCPENNSYGYTTIMLLRNMGYPKLYRSDNKEVWGDSNSLEIIKKYGINMHRYDRPAIMSKMEEVLRNNQIKLYSSRTVAQLFDFILNSSNKAIASKGKKDDLVLSLAIGIWLFSNAELSNNFEKEKQNKALLDNLSMDMIKNEDIMNSNRDEDYNVFVPKTMNPYGSDFKDIKNVRVNKNWFWLYK